MPVSACGHIISLFTHARERKASGSRACDNDYTARRVDEYNGGNCNNCFAPGKNRETIHALSLCVCCAYTAAVERTK